jgi:hypothetical protein
MDKNLEKLEKLLRVIEEGVTKEEFTKAFESLVSYVIKIEKRNNEEIEYLKEGYKSGMAEIRKNVDATISELKKMVNNVFVEDRLSEMHRSINDKLANVDEKMSMVRNGKDADETRVMRDVMKNIRLPKDGSPDTPEEIRNKLEKLYGENRLDKSAIRGLEEIENAIIDMKNVGGKTFMVGGKARNSIHIHDLSSQLNGVDKTFDLPSNFGIVGVWCSSMPNAFRPTIDYTEGNKTITFTDEINAATTLATGQTLILQYIK